MEVARNRKTSPDFGPIYSPSIPPQTSPLDPVSESPLSLCNTVPSVPCSVRTRPTCLLIYTGGTFGMVPKENGALHPTSGFLANKIQEMDEFHFETMPKITVTEWDDPIDSSDMTPEDYKRLAKEIEQSYWEYDGFVILQGTDTMAYTASALSFMLEYLGKTVVISGAMIPLHFPHSDARRNLIMSVMCASTLGIPEVCVYSNDKLLRGNRTTKIANMTVDAFQSPNCGPLACTGVETTVDQSLVLPYPHRRFRIFTELCTNIGVFYLIPGFDDACIDAYIQGRNSERPDDRKAIVFALYGTGNAPSRRKSFLQAVENAIHRDIPVVVTSQCVQGRTQLDAYATGLQLYKLGVITSFDMTIEATVNKLAYLMGKGLGGLGLKRKMESNLRGELSVLSSCGVGEELQCVQRLLQKTIIKNFVS